MALFARVCIYIKSKLNEGIQSVYYIDIMRPKIIYIFKLLLLLFSLLSELIFIVDLDFYYNFA